jgi:hypothetical protein
MVIPSSVISRGKEGLEEDHVAADGVVDALGLPDELGGGTQAVEVRRRRRPPQDEPLDLELVLVGELEAGPVEELDAVVLVRVVAGADDDSGVGPHRLGDEGDPRRGKRAAEEDVDAHGADARGDGGLQHVAGQPGVLADDDAVAVGAGADLPGQRTAELERHLGGDGVDVGDAADPVRPEEPSLRPCPVAVSRTGRHGCLPAPV